MICIAPLCNLPIAKALSRMVQVSCKKANTGQKDALTNPQNQATQRAGINHCARILLKQDFAKNIAKKFLTVSGSPAAGNPKAQMEQSHEPIRTCLTR